LSELVGCADCGRVQLVPAATREVVPECGCCGHAFAPPIPGNFTTALAYTLAALLLLLPAFLAPLMRITTFGITRSDLLPTGVQAVWRDGFQLLAIPIALFSMAIPILYLLLMIYVLQALRRGQTDGIGRVFRYANALRPWLMIEVFLVGCCVAYTRLEAVGNIQIDLGGWCFIGACIAWLALALKLDARMVWDALPPSQPRIPLSNSLSCGSCELLVEARLEHSNCPRCDAQLHMRKPDSIRRTTALVIAGYLLYVPANILPILTIERFGHNDTNTILGGVRELISTGLWPLAVVVFTASIILPLVKLLGLTMMLVMTKLHSKRWLLGRTRLYRLIDMIGRWSNIDVFMISLLAALVQFGSLTTVRPEPGGLAFAAVVILTMIASRCFDSRLMWDAAES
jgi:paraquat-inducible protein A